MVKKANPAKAAQKRKTESEEEANLLRSLRTHKQVVESDREDAPLGPGQTHVYVKKPGEAAGRLIEKRKSLVKR
jgi:hypothetical protein